MDRILVDTNVVLDLLGKRESFLKEAQELFTLGDKGKVKLFVSALTFANTYYILSQQLKVSSARKVLRQFKVLVEVVPIDDKVIELALDSEFKDFEDAIQYYSAIENGVRIIITRNQKDFKHSKIPVLSAKEYLGMKG
ncbi:type II toxin-antitoxin system VapC family toxin [Cyclobacterium qasimii]|uniref:PIN domain protein n=2 Tax=Cyclobacterium qasimii TaxID=1350429 RepID=S7WYG6_9BACT|nr:PIN domain-containing protein [Cyclobacterium qasimii]EPR71829.1 PIN domain protein [Cyclobacterium qasimii M12-11B]GEO22127.1 PIN domain-containing protein [Cyclobacterium qasimii]|tara:strand:- start:10180 stop:10593 length:414 start_codon:yes stop_codon:yes gene_type:complete